MNIRFLEPARIELDDAVEWYEMEQSGLVRRFLAEFSLPGDHRRCCAYASYAAVLAGEMTESVSGTATNQSPLLFHLVRC